MRRAYQRATLREVARVAGVSPSTASRVLNGGDLRVSDELSARVLAVAAPLGYVSNQAAQALRGRRTAIVLVTSDPRTASIAAIAADSNARWAEGGYTDAAKFRRDVLLDYLTALGRVVKDSAYSIYTRANTVGDARPVAENEVLRSRGEHTIDFIGYDPYTKDIDTFYYYGINSFWARERNFPMVMETFAGSSNAHVMKFNSIAGGSAHNLYAATDGYATTGSSDFGLYDFDPVTRAVTRKHVSYEVRDLNHTINKISRDLATKAPVEDGGAYLQTYNRAAATEYAVTRPLADLDLRYATTNGGQGIAVERSRREFALISIDGGGTYSLPASYGTVSSVQLGRYDANDSWCGRAPSSTRPPTGPSTSRSPKAKRCAWSSSSRTFARERRPCTRRDRHSPGHLVTELHVPTLTAGLVEIASAKAVGR